MGKILVIGVGLPSKIALNELIKKGYDTIIVTEEEARKHLNLPEKNNVQPVAPIKLSPIKKVKLNRWERRKQKRENNKRK